MNNVYQMFINANLQCHCQLKACSSFQGSLQFRTLFQFFFNKERCFITTGTPFSAFILINVRICDNILLLLFAFVEQEMVCGVMALIAVPLFIRVL